ncbi:MAG: DUF5668 domain-containing protein [Chloroflexi bacterium]|nr:DUF5668 domain-containing protein [Chloroflexota bacterium]
MRQNSLFWGAILVLFGAVLLLSNLGIFRVNVWSLLWPLFLILLGAWILFGVLGGGRPATVEQISIPLDGSTQAHVHIHHGAGRLSINGSAAPGVLMAGAFGGGLDYSKRNSGTAVSLDMRSRWSGFMWGPWPWGGRGAYDWDMALSRDIPIALKVETGASESEIDLTDLRVSDVHVSTGASSTTLTVPSNAGYTRVRLEAGAASIKVRVPGGVAAQVRSHSGVSSINVDQTRFPGSGNVYQSPDYATAVNKVDIDIQMGAGSVDVF